MDEYLPHALSIDEVDSILDEMKRQADEDILFVRDYTFFELIYSCGLRISEAVNLKVSSYTHSDSLRKEKQGAAGVRRPDRLRRA